MIEARKRLYDEYGVFLNKVENFGFEGEAGMTKMQEIMANLRKSSITNIGGLKVLATTDYQSSVKKAADGTESKVKLPKSNVITYNLENDAGIIIRPSGTEPKIKVYYTTKAPARDIAVEIQKELSSEFTKILGV